MPGWEGSGQNEVGLGVGVGLENKCTFLFARYF